MALSLVFDTPPDKILIVLAFPFLPQHADFLAIVVFHLCQLASQTPTAKCQQGWLLIRRNDWSQVVHLSWPYEFL